jgi:hypothetical protein
LDALVGGLNFPDKYCFALVLNQLRARYMQAAASLHL